MAKATTLATTDAIPMKFITGNWPDVADTLDPDD
jgi:hypothetical protein